MPLRFLDDQKPLEEYLEIKAEISRLEDRMDELKPLILTAVMEEPDGEGYHLGCRLSYYRRKYYSYSPKVQKMEKQLKAAKKYEENSGLADVQKEIAILRVEADRREFV